MLSNLQTLTLVVLLCCCPCVASADESKWLLTEAPTAATTNSPAAPNLQHSLKKMGGGLAVVLGGFFLLTVLMRKRSDPRSANELMEAIGAVQIAPKVKLHLVRLGSRILVLHISGQNVQRVAELDDPAEVEQLLSSRQNTDAVSMPPISVGELLKSVEKNSPQVESLRGAR